MRKCSHCVEIVQGLRACGMVLEASSVHHGMAFARVAREEGHSLEDMIELLRTLDKQERQSVPPAAARAQVLWARGEREV